jgi:asparagine synthase (glutamine-hydrolysing)
LNGTHKKLLRELSETRLPTGIVEAPKRTVQTPQREWLRGDLKEWAEDCVEAGLEAYGGIWLDRAAVRSQWRTYCNGAGDNSFYVWQWINLGLWQDLARS